MPFVAKDKRRGVCLGASIYGTVLWVLVATLSSAQPTPADSNVAFPVSWLEQLLGFETWSVSDVRGVRFEDDLARRGTLEAPSGERFEIKVRPARGRDEFNNVPRYELAAYHLQRLFLEPEDYVVPPTFFRAFPLETVRAWGEMDLEPTYEESDQVFFVVQYWLQNVSNPPDPLDQARFEHDPSYARHIANLNVLTYLIEHRDANQGNVLLSTDPQNPRVFSVDNGVSFGSNESEQGSIWRRMRVPAVPSKTVERLRAIDLDELRANLAVISEHRLENERYAPVAVSEALQRRRGVRRNEEILQLGLTERELRALGGRVSRLLRQVERGELDTF